MLSDYEKLTDREIDALVALRFMRWGTAQTLPENPNLPHYSTDDNAARLVRDRIAELGLDEQFERALIILLGHLQYSTTRHPAFPLMQAPARIQMIAALQSLDTRERTSES